MGCVRNRLLNKATGDHFNLPGNNMDYVNCTSIKKVGVKNLVYGRKREKVFINKLNSLFNENNCLC